MTEEVDPEIQHLVRENASLRADIAREKSKLQTARGELRQARLTIGRLERALDGYDEDAFDPAKQKGVGCVPVGGDFRQVEAIERHLFRMGSTLDEEFARLGLGDDQQVAKILQAHDDVRDGDVRTLLGVLMAIALKARVELGRDDEQVAEPYTRVPLEEAKALIAAVDQLPEQLLTDLVDVEGWDGSGLPSLKPATGEGDR